MYGGSFERRSCVELGGERKLAGSSFVQSMRDAAFLERDALVTLSTPRSGITVFRCWMLKAFRPMMIVRGLAKIYYVLE